MVQETFEAIRMAAGGHSEVKCEQLECCAGCSLKITDRFLLRMMDASWHEECLVCSVCRVRLTQSCFTKDNKVFCKYDYERLYLVKCSGCGERALPHELVMRAQTQVYHMQCFVCVVCCQLLQKGDQFVLRQGQLLCRADYEKEMFMLQQTQGDFWDAGIPGLDLGDETGRPRDGRRGPKRPRTILTSAQRRQFKASFEVSPKPCRKIREALAKETGLSVRVVQVWFQNQRAKMKKLQRRAKQQQDGQDKDKPDKKDAADATDKKADADYVADSPYGSGTPSVGHPYSPDAQSNESFCGSDDVSLEDTASFENLDESHAEPNMMQTSSAPQPLDMMQNYGSINPIDKLYLMQNSYFTDRDH
ncbi:LIM homeobox transcription factor 1-beta.1-like [Amphibalanus amphitrite]|uniref:LIM homeobox transcription factor 1-beta.1-like n=1 Tax=Amphibalanus amphitrite TaxID=1232801 RepID=UPI001C919F71|nr:LIM homeobox transcription factor 1-beta.1-like [Amphibalanus amphitrite]